MRRKILMGVAALALPIGTLVGLQTSASAGGPKPPPDPALNCPISGPVNFAPPGLSASGSVTNTKTSTTNATVTPSGACAGSPAISENIVSKNTKCKAAGNPVAACTAKGQESYDSESGFASAGTSAIQKSLKKVNFTLNGIAYQTKTTSTAEISCNDPAIGNGGVETGFSITGTVKKPKQDKGQTTTLTACLGTDTDPGGSGNFTIDLGDGQGTISAAQIDGVTSSVTTSG